MVNVGLAIFDQWLMILKVGTMVDWWLIVVDTIALMMA